MRPAFLLLVAATLSIPTRGQEPSLIIEPLAHLLTLEDQAAYEVGIQLRGEPMRWLAWGWSGVDEATTAALDRNRRHLSDRAVFVHPPYRVGPGTIVQQFTIRLPEAPAAILRGATSTAEEASRGDGVTFRLRADDQLLWEKHHASSTWESFAVDLSRWAGGTVVLRFETDCGPADNTSYDWAFWGNRVIELPGYPAQSSPLPAPPALDLTRLSAQPNDDVTPLSAFPGQHSLLVDNDAGVIELRYEGDDGQLRYRWQWPQTATAAPLGQWTLHATMRGGDAVEVPLATGNMMEWTHSVQLEYGDILIRDDAVHCTTRWRAGDEHATITMTARLVGKSIVLEIDCDQPWVRRLEAGRWGPVAHQRRLSVPYCAGPIDLLPRQNLFVGQLTDWTVSSASSLTDVGALYQPLTGGTYNRLHERVIFSAAWHLAEVFPNLPHPASPYRQELGSRVVFDIWGGRYNEIAAALASLGAYGIRNHAVIVHNWQHHGYDNGLPTHFPANPQWGSEDDLRQLMATGKAWGHLMALHENYVDYYPNYEHFDANHVALDSDGQPQKAWYNPGTRIQSLAVAPHVMVQLAQTQSPEIHRRYGTNASFLDVSSCVPPWFHTDQRAGIELAGSLRQVWNAHRALWAYLRATHEGPVLGEGNGHWLWSGWLDGVEAQFGTGWPHNAGMIAPLLVDFDLLRIHPLQLNHGMGYFSRWYDDAPWGDGMPMVVLDQYRLQEVAFGHAGFLNSNWNRLQDVWLETHLLAPVTTRHATARVVGIEYHVADQWVDTTAAVKAEQLDRVRITWDSGLVVIANTRAEPWEIEGFTLPRFGWVARGPDLLAYTALRDDEVADFLQTPDMLFANARHAVDWQVDRQTLAARPAVTSFAQTGPRRFRVSYAWESLADIQGEGECFVTWHEPMSWANRPWHQRLLDRHTPTTPTSAWLVGQRIVDGPHDVELPATLENGEYLWEIALQASDNNRVPLDGYCDGQQRVRLGTLVVRETGNSLAFRAVREVEPRSAWQTRHLNVDGRVIDFGALRTDGSISLQREGDVWQLRTFPRDRSFTLQFNPDAVAPPVLVTAQQADGHQQMITPRIEQGRWSIELNGAAVYSWPALTLP